MLVFLLPIFTAIGSIYKLPIVPYIVLTAVILVITLVALEKIKNYPIYIFALSLSLIWQTSMIGTYIVGTDVHSEYYVVNHTIQNGWDINWNNIGNTSILLTIIAPTLAKIGFNPIWQFKALYPFIAAFVPLILYFSFKNIVNNKIAFFSAILFAIMPMFTMEIAGIAKSQVAFLFLSGIVYLTTSKTKELKRIIAITLLTIGTIITHYTIGIVAILYLLGIFTISIKLSTIKYIAPSAIITTSFFFVWFGSIGQGNMINLSESVISATTTNLQKENNQSSLVKTAIGKDFSKSSIYGKAFRIIQYLFEAMILLGSVISLLSKKLPIEYRAGIICSLTLLACSIFIPSFSTVAITTTRLFSITLLFLIPTAIIGIKWIKEHQLSFQ